MGGTPAHHTLRESEGHKHTDISITRPVLQTMSYHCSLREREKQTEEMEETGYRERQTQKRDGRGDWVRDREEREE